ARKIAELNSGIVPIVEPGLAELVQEQVRLGRVRATVSAEEAVRGSTIGVIAVGTPSGDDGSVSSVSVERVIRSIGESLRNSDRKYLICVRSTLLPGILEQRLLPLLEETCGDRLHDKIEVCNHPEFLREGHAIRDYDNPPFVVVGAKNPAAAE